MKYILLLFLNLIFFSCSQNSIENYLTGKDIKFWDVQDSLHSTKYCYSFSKDGTCRYYYYTDSCTRNLMFDDDVIYENTWELKNDSNLVFRSSNRKIYLVNSDTLLLVNDHNHLLLLKAPCQKP